MKLFECGIRYNKTLENGQEKKVTELYIVDALSFSEAEQRIIKEMSAYGEYEVVSEKITNYSELVRSNDTEADLWYKVKVNLITLDEKTGKEKKAPLYLLVQAKNIDDARRLTNEHMKDSVADWNCEAVSETKIMDVFVYGEESKKPVCVDVTDKVRQAVRDKFEEHNTKVCASDKVSYCNKTEKRGKARDDI